MDFKTRYNHNQAVFIIENNRIIQLSIKDIKICKYPQFNWPEILYSFCVQKAITSLDKDVIIWRNEDDVYATADEIIAPFKV